MKCNPTSLWARPSPAAFSRRSVWRARLRGQAAQEEQIRRSLPTRSEARASLHQPKLGGAIGAHPAPNQTVYLLKCEGVITRCFDFRSGGSRWPRSTEAHVNQLDRMRACEAAHPIGETPDKRSFAKKERHGAEIRKPGTDRDHVNFQLPSQARRRAALQRRIHNAVRPWGRPEGGLRQRGNCPPGRFHPRLQHLLCSDRCGQQAGRGDHHFDHEGLIGIRRRNPAPR